jgi:hypothetical protein
VQLNSQDKSSDHGLREELCIDSFIPKPLQIPKRNKFSNRMKHPNRIGSNLRQQKKRKLKLTFDKRKEKPRENQKKTPE